MKNEGRIVRSDKTGKSKYTPISNDILQSKDLSCEQKSILVHLLSLPLDWDIYKTTFWKRMNIGRDRFYKAWKGLEELGYVVKNKIFSKNLVVGYNYIVYEEPVSVNPNLSKTEIVKNTIPESCLLEIGETENRSTRTPVDIQSTYEQKNIIQTNEVESNNTKDINTSINTGPVILGEIEQLQENYRILYIQKRDLLNNIETSCQTGKKLTSEISKNGIKRIDQIENYQRSLRENEIEELQQMVDQYWEIEEQFSKNCVLLDKKFQEKRQDSTEE